MLKDGRAPQQIFFGPDEHPEDMLKAFKEFCQTFELLYDAQYPDPPKVSIDSAIQRWKVKNTTEDVSDPKPSLAHYDAICMDGDLRTKLLNSLGCFHLTDYLQIGKLPNLMNSKEKKQTGTHLLIE